MSMKSLIQSITRLTLANGKQHFSSNRHIHTNSSPLYFKVSQILYAEPLKKKKRLDPAIIKAREERRKKKIEKQIRRLEKNARQLKPIDELEVPLYLVDNEKQHKRQLPPLSAEVLEQRVLLEKQWARYKREQHLKDIQMFDRIMQSQQKALDELRKESEELYQEAIQMDLTLLPYTTKGPVRTPAIKSYESPDGEYIDISRKWD
ncbi:39S ribosomal protein L40, mitochondrial [Chrysoperla carnea]|uniref:39S ribosomal protein L40, mitochondrial n=1 Tax=Chrysoperla carnea TaxID=189513 RepID=UPI001D078E42|nr:39S ribosomal protein L40, mitochondrial [Chrysoperla carnea]